MSNTFPAQTENGIEDVRKDVTVDGQAVVFTSESGDLMQEKGGRLEGVDAPLAMNTSSGENAVEASADVPDDESDAVKEMEAAVEEATGTKATLTASEAQNLTGEPMESAAPAEVAPEAAPEEAEVDATPAAEAKAEELGVDLAEVEGSGADGRVTVGDVEAAADEA